MSGTGGGGGGGAAGYGREFWRCVGSDSCMK